MKPVDIEGREFKAELLQKEITTPSTPVAGKRKLYAKADGFYQLDSTGAETKVGSGSGSGSGSINYCLNPDFETNAVGWSDYYERSAFEADVAFINVSTNVFSSSYSGRDGDAVLFETTGTVPGGLTANTVYYIKRIDSFSYTLAATKGGATIDITSIGSGIHTIRYLTPITGTGTWASGGATLTRSTTAPLRGTASGLLSKPASRATGNGEAYAFTIDPADKTTILEVGFDYGISSGTYNDADVQCFVYDVTNSAIIYPIENQNVLSHALPSSRHKFKLQTSTSTSYRLLLHIAGTGTNAFDMLVDNVTIGPQVSSRGPAMTDWASYTPTSTSNTGGATNVTWTGQWRRVGSDAEYQVKATFTGTSGAFSQLYPTLPSGHAIDSSRMQIGANAYTVIGQASFGDNGVDNFTGHVTYNGTTNNVSIITTGVSGTSVKPFGPSNTTPFTFGAGDTITASFTVPILGWSSNVAVSSDVSGRIIVGQVADSGTPQSLPNNTWTAVTTALSATAYLDSVNSWDGVNKRWNILESGYYEFMYKGSWTVNGNGDRGLALSINGGESFYAVTRASAGDGTHPRHSSGPVYLTAKDTVGLRAYQSSGAALNIVGAEFAIKKLNTGSQQIAATEEVYESYKSSAGQSLTAATPNTFVAATKIESSHGAYNTTTGEFIAPRAGLVEYEGFNVTNSVAWGAGSTIYGGLQVNGTLAKWIGAGPRSAAAGTSLKEFNSRGSVRVVAGDKVKFVISPDVAVTLTTTPESNYSTFRMK